MTGPGDGRSGVRVLVNLAALRRGGGLTHVAGFLPELVASRPQDSFFAVAPTETAELVRSWGLRVRPHGASAGSPRLRLQHDQLTTRGHGRRCDILLSPMNHGPVAAGVPQILWACNALHFEAARSTSERVNGAFARAAMRRADLVVYPTAHVRLAAERAGVRAPGLILRHPIRVSEKAAPAPRTRTGVLQILVPSSHQPHKNLALLPRMSRVLSSRGIDHHIRVTAPLSDELTTDRVSGDFRYELSEMGGLVEAFDVVLMPSTSESYSYPLVEFERWGMPVAASSIGAHLELRNQARLFDPASPHGAADAVLAALADGRGRHAPHDRPDWRFHTPETYAAAVSTEMGRLLEGDQ